MTCYQQRIHTTQTRGREQTFRKDLVLVLGVSFLAWDGPPSKFRRDVCPSDWTGAIATCGARLAFPQGSVGCGVVQVFGVFATCRGFPIETEAGGGTLVWLLPSCGASNARCTGTLILKRFCQTIATSTAVVVVKLAFVAGLACGGTGCAGCSPRAIFTRIVGCRAAFCSGGTGGEPGGRSGINFRPKWYDDRGRPSFGHD